MNEKDIEPKKKIRKKHCGGWIYCADGPMAKMLSIIVQNAKNKL